jgi:hypothetical protein
VNSIFDAVGCRGGIRFMISNETVQNTERINIVYVLIILPRDSPSSNLGQEGNSAEIVFLSENEPAEGKNIPKKI